MTFLKILRPPKTTCDATNTYVSLNSNLDVTYKVSNTIPGAPRENLEEAEAGINYTRVMTDISLPCDGEVTFELTMK